LGTTCHASASDTRHEPPHAVDVADLRKRRGVTGSAAGRGNGAAHKISPTHHKDATTVCVPVYETALASRCRWPSTSGRCVTHVVPLSREDICHSHNATLRRPAAISLQTHVPGRGSTSRTRQAWHRSRWLPGSLIATGRTAPRWSQVRVSCQASEAAASRSLGTSVSSSSGDTPVADVDVGGDRRA
jgi:hypothetical protein